MSDPLAPLAERAGTEVRTYTLEGLETREGDDGRHYIRGIVAPWGATYDAGSYVETFGASVFDKSITERGDRIPLTEQHNRDRFPVGRAYEWESTADGLVGTFRLATSDRGREALSAAADGMVGGLSVGFIPIRNKTGRTSAGRKLVTRVEARLDHVGLVTDPAYGEARILEARSFDPDDPATAPRLARWRHLIKTAD